jgi:hypothetical protein
MAKALKAFSFKAPETIKASDAQFIATTKNSKGKLTGAGIKNVIAYIRTLQKERRARQAQTVGVRTGGDRQQPFLSRTWKRLDRSELKK